MSNEHETPTANITPGVVCVTYRPNVSLYRATELWSICELRPVKDGITYNRNFPPSMVQCVLSVPVGEEIAWANRINGFDALVSKAKPIPRHPHPEGPFGC